MAAVADVDGRVDVDAEADAPTPPPTAVDAEALVLGDALADDDVLADADGDVELAVPDDAGAGELVAGVPQAASTASTSVSSIVVETRCFIRSVTPHTK